MEGPSIVLLKEEVRQFRRKKIIGVQGNTKIDKERLLNQTILDFKSWGKHFIIQFKTFSLRVHFLMFGSYSINRRKQREPRLRLQFKTGEINFYTCSVQFIGEDLEEVYAWHTDVMSDAWSANVTLKALRKNKDMVISDALLDQNLFTGVGNIIKNEVLFRVSLHPESIVKAIPLKKLKDTVQSARDYSFDFLKWKRVYQLKKHWLIYTKKKCPRCNLPVIKKYTGVTQRRSFFCTNCQVLYVK